MFTKIKFLHTIGIISLLFCNWNIAADDQSAGEALNPPAATAPEIPRRDHRIDERDSILKQSYTRYPDSKECRTDSVCQAYCGAIYQSKRLTNKCLAFPLLEVENFWTIYDTLTDPNELKLDDIDPENFAIFAKNGSSSIYGPSPILRVVKGYNFSDAKEVLTWIADRYDIAKTLYSVDRDFRVLQGLFTKLDPDIKTALWQKKVEGKEGFMDKIIYWGNDDAFNWVHEFFEEQCGVSACGGVMGSELCVLQNWYCQANLNDETWDDLLNHESFYGTVDAILDYPITSPPSWWNQDIRVDDLDISQLKSLCNAEMLFHILIKE